MMRLYSTALLGLLVAVLALQGCKDGTVIPEQFGSIRGQVQDYESYAAISAAGITTSPATGALITGEDGTFTIDNVPVGSYTITANRNGYKPNTATVAVRQGQTTAAALFLRRDDGTSVVDSTSFGAEVLNVTNEPFATDSSYVTVEYRALNNGNATISTYEIYFRIDTNRGPFYQEIQGKDLGAGQRDLGTFRKYLLGATASTVVVEGTSPRN